MSARDNLCAAISKSDSITAEIASAHAKAADLLATADTAEAEADEVESATVDRDATTLASGMNCSGPTGDEERRADRLRKKARAARRAAELAAESIGQLKAQVAQAELALSDAALIAFRADRDGAQAAALEIVASLAPHMARLVAADQVRRVLIGDRYRFNAAEHPPVELWSGEIVASAFAKSVPDRLRPEGFAETIDAVAKSIAAETLASFKGKAK